MTAAARTIRTSWISPVAGTARISRKSSKKKSQQQAAGILATIGTLTTVIASAGTPTAAELLEKV
jgi:hypothetical protein